MGSWSGSSVERLLRGVLRRRKRLFLIASLIAMVVLLPVAFIAVQGATALPCDRRGAARGPARPGPGLPGHVPQPSLPGPDGDPGLPEPRRDGRGEPAQGLAAGAARDLVPDQPPGARWSAPTRAGAASSLRRPNPKRRALAELQRARVSFQPWPDKSGIITISAEASRPDGLRRHHQHLHRSAHVPDAHLQHR